MDYVQMTLFKYISCYSLSRAILSGKWGLSEFKYISCYSLSKYIRLKATINNNLNTSHVILYPNTLVNKQSLSLFKYISCYSLSLAAAAENPAQANLNTSHVILYLPYMLRVGSFLNHLNTSHVILYQLEDAMDSDELIFKYISCYSLSCEGEELFRTGKI